jgi:hypothetical protein
MGDEDWLIEYGNETEDGRPKTGKRPEMDDEAFLIRKK